MDAPLEGIAEISASSHHGTGAHFIWASLTSVAQACAVSLVDNFQENGTGPTAPLRRTRPAAVWSVLKPSWRAWGSHYFSFLLQEHLGTQSRVLVLLG